nr:HNH endonuclease [Ipomoea batatas]
MASNPLFITPINPFLHKKAAILVHQFPISSTGRRLSHRRPIVRASISRRQLITAAAALIIAASSSKPADKLLPTRERANYSTNKSKQERPRFFDLAARKMCWAKAETVPGRDPGRWRKDAAGNVVGKRFHSCLGCLCFEYDHVVPFSKGGESVPENCQILQTKVNRFKADKVAVDKMQLKGYSCGVNFSDKELDTIEIAVYGDVMRPGNRCRVATIDEMLGLYKSKNRIVTCNSAN